MTQFKASVSTKLVQFGDHPRTLAIDRTATTDQPKP